MGKKVCRAKFNCVGITKRAYGKDEFTHEAEFSAVYPGTEENEQYFKATPSGSLKIATLKADFFEPGKSYYLDFIEAD